MPPRDLRVDYDAIAHLYDEPLRDHAMDSNLVAFVEDCRLESSGVAVLDIGYGTGKQLAANRRAFPDMALVGVDRFRGMLRHARAREPSVQWVQGDAAALPFSAGSFDYATNQYSYPHVRAPEAFVAEVARVLRHGGRFVLTNIDPWSMEDWLIYRYFPASRALDGREFVEVGRLVALLQRVGFREISVDRDARREVESLASALDYCSSRHRTSQLVAISDGDYASGLESLRRDAVPGATAESTMCFVTIRADRS